MSESTQHQTILVIADIFFGSKLKGEVQSLGYDYKAAAGPKKGLERAKEFRPAAVILHLEKSGLDFKAFLEQLREDEETKDIPVIGFCGHMDVQRMADARELGCLAGSNGEISGNFSDVLQQALEG